MPSNSPWFSRKSRLKAISGLVILLARRFLGSGAENRDFGEAGARVSFEGEVVGSGEGRPSGRSGFFGGCGFGSVGFLTDDWRNCSSTCL